MSSMIDGYEREKLKDELGNYVMSVTEPDPRAGRNMYKCPLCGSGSQAGRNHNGAFSITKDGKTWKCFSCGKSGDIFTLIGLLEGKNGFLEQLQRAKEFGGYTLSTKCTNEYNVNRINKVNEVNKKTENPRKYRRYIEACQANAQNTDYFGSRGFDTDTVKRFGLGYDGKKDVIVIPYDSKGSYYITRSTKGKQFRKPKSEEAGIEPVYNKEALYGGKPCFVCESPIDAISIMAAGNGACEAVALGGTGSQKLINQIKTKVPNCMLILSFDNDEAGRKATNEVVEELHSLNIPFITASYNLDEYPDNRRKDANDLLRSNKSQFEADIKENISKAECLANTLNSEILKEHKSKSVAERLKNFNDEIHRGFFVSTGFGKLDKELDGGFYPGLYILGAISSLGKTTLMLQIADNIAQIGNDVLYFSLEMAACELMSKTISRYTYTLCGKDRAKAKTARGITTASRYQGYNREVKELIGEAVKFYGTYAEHLYIYEGIGNIGVEEIKKQVEEHKRLTGRTPLVFIDYLQILSPYDMRASDKQNTDKSVLELKRLSRDFNTTVVGISSFNRESYGTEVNMAAFKESGAIEYGSDVLIALQPQGMEAGYKKEERERNIELVKSCKSRKERSIEAVVLKNRNGKTGGRVGFNYHTLFNYFEVDENYINVEEEETADSGIKI